MAETSRHPALPALLAAICLVATAGTSLGDDANAPAQTDPNALIVHLHRLALDRAPTDAERAASRTMLQRSAGYETVLIDLIDGEAYRKRERSDDEFIADVFRLTLGRKPTGEETKSSREKLQSGTSRLVQAMTLMASPEYKTTRTRRLAGKPDNPKQPAPKPKANQDKKNPKPKAKKQPRRKNDPDGEAKPKPKAKSKPKTGAKPTPKQKQKPERKQVASAASTEEIAAARTAMHTAWGKLADLMTDRHVALRSDRLADARQAYFDARAKLNALLARQVGGKRAKGASK